MMSGLDVGWFELPLDDTGTSFKMQSSLNSDGVVSGLLKVSRAQRTLLMKSPNTIMTTIFTKMDKMVLILMLSERNVLRRGSCWERRSKVQIRTSCWVGSPASKLCIAHTTSLMMLGQVEHCIIYTALYRTLHILYVLAPNDKLCRFHNNTVKLLFNIS